MKKLFFLVFLFSVVLFSGCIMNQIKKNEINFQDYTLKSGEIPSGFQFEILSDEAIKEGYTNPGFINNTELINQIYQRVDTSKIEKVYNAVYINSNKSLGSELGITVVKYKSENNLNQELKNFSPRKEGDSIYLRNKDVLVVVWSDGGYYMELERQIADKLKIRLNLQEISV